MPTVKFPSPHIFAIRVYYEDTDFSGAVYHANYLRFFERARTEFLRELGISQAALFDDGRGLGFVVRTARIDYLKPARMDEELRIETHIEKLGGASIEVAQTLRRDETIVATAKIRLALVASGRVRPIPRELHAKLHGQLQSKLKAATRPETGALADRQDAKSERNKS